MIELFNQIVHRIGVRAERKVVKELLKDLQKVHGKHAILFRIAEASLENPTSSVKEVVYPIVGEERLKNLVKEYKSSGTQYKSQVHTIIRASYGNHYRRMVPKILDNLEFRSNNKNHRPSLDALEWLKKNRDLKKQYLYFGEDIIDDSVIPPKWKSIVIENHNGNDRINRINYEICVLQTLREKLRCKEIWVAGSNKYRNPDEDLPDNFEEKKEKYYKDLGLSQDAKAFVSQLKDRMTQSLRDLNKSIPKNPKVKIKPQGKNRICITPLDEQPPPENILQLKREITSKWPMTNLLDVLKEADIQVSFTKDFRSSGQREILDQQTLQKRLLLCLYGMGTNTGLKRVASHQKGTTYKELLKVRKKYIHRDALREATSQVANAIFKVRNPAIWGEGTSACASDSKKFGSWDQNLMTEWHIRYGGRGVMIYWHVEKNSTCIYSQLKRCSSSEVASMITGVLHHCTEMEIDKQYVDSHGQSAVAFAFCHLLGFNLMPRLKAMASQKLYRAVSSTVEDYSNLSPIMSKPIKWDLIIQQYDEMVKYATALKQGIADPESILRRFTRSNATHPTYKAFAELGKVIKTIFLCNYIESEEIRREIHEGLNVVENWNSANSFIFFGKGGEVATNRLEDQELSVLALSSC